MAQYTKSRKGKLCKMEFFQRLQPPEGTETEVWAGQRTSVEDTW